ncbi:hypothetical protein BKI52_09890 [marine bacterium AO1-C]|nr:hypothetical protein BKI52_09890 [marine bacterium AO1-C]
MVQKSMLAALKVCCIVLFVIQMANAQTSKLPKLFQAENGLWGYRGYLGQTVIQPQFQKARSFQENVAAVQKNGQWGYINAQGAYVVKPLYQNALSFQDGYAKVAMNSQWGLLNSAGKVTITPKYEQLFLVIGLGRKKTSLAKALKDGLYALVDKTNGKQLSPFQYKAVATYMKYGRLVVESKDKKFGFVNNSGQEIVACKYEKVENFDASGKALVHLNNKKIYIDRQGKYLRDYNPFNDAPIFLIVEEPPTPKGGLVKFEETIEQNLQYPKEAKEKRISGIVVVQFVVEMDGSLTNVKVVKGIGAGCDEEAVRLIKASAPWNSGKQRGKPVRVRKSKVVNFKL